MQRDKADYQGWSEQLEKLNNTKPKSAQRGEVWRYYVGVNVGNEIGKGRQGDYSRTGIILCNSLKNGLLLVAPITTKYSWFTSLNGLQLKNYEGRDARVLLDQIQLIDRRRLSNIKKRKSGKGLAYSRKFVKKLLKMYQRLFVHIKKSTFTSE